MQTESIPGILWFLAVALLVWLFQWLKQRERMRIYELIHRERTQAIDKGLPYPELPPYLIEKEEKEESQVRKPFGTSQLIGFACILILGGAAAMWAMRNSGEEYHQRVWTMGAVPVALGFGLIVYAALNRPK